MIRAGWFGAAVVVVASAPSCGARTELDSVSVGPAKNGGAGGRKPTEPAPGSAGRAGAQSGGTGGAVILDASSGSGGIGGADGCAASILPVDRFSTADVIVVLQNTPSMSKEAGLLQSSMNGFAQRLLSTGLDARFVLISGAGPASATTAGVCVPPPLGSGRCPDDSNPPRYLRVDENVGSQDALTKLTSSFSKFSAQLRQSSMRYFLLISDSNARGIVAEQFAQTLTSTYGVAQPWAFYGLVCKGCLGVDCWEVGVVYEELAQLRPGGSFNLCQAQDQRNFDAVLQVIAGGIVDDFVPGCTFALPPVPGTGFDADRVNLEYYLEDKSAVMPRVSGLGSCGTRLAWYYDDPIQPTRVELCPAACDAIGMRANATLNVVFGCPTVTV